MNAEHILDAIGLLDDSLIQEAEAFHKRRPSRRSWLAWAACFAVVILLGYGAARLELIPSNNSQGSSAAGGAGGEASNGGSIAPEEFPTGAEPAGPEASAGGGADKSSNGETLTIRVERGGESYSFRGQPGESRTLEALPDGCVSLGRLERLGGGGAPSTDSDAYLGCQVWFSEETGALYLELPQGGYLELEAV